MPEITVIAYNQNSIFEAPVGTNLMDFLRDHHFPIEAPCGGNGTCRKCMVSLQKAGENNENNVLSCRTQIDGNCTVRLSSKRGGLIETDSVLSQSVWEFRTGLGAAVDLGTTTVVVSLYDLSCGKKLGTQSEWNCQSSYGADVISRISYCMSRPRGLDIMGRAIRRQIRLMIQQLMDQAGVYDLKEIVIAGNTIMQHIFAGENPSSIAAAPFIPETLFTDKKVYTFNEFRGCQVSLIPCVAGYVGGDIVSGLLASGLPFRDETSLFLDIGTNGEMAIGGKNGFLCCSVASGPAFEGAQISCGMRSISGAINHVSYKEDSNRLTLSVIGGAGQKPAGLCGSGLIDLLALLLRTGAVDETGRMLSPGEIESPIRSFLTEDENENGIFWLDENRTVCLRPEDVRQLQLAKAAVAAGIRILLKRSGLTIDEIDHVYLAGGFGHHLDPSNVGRIGMIPQELTDRMIPIGNSSLAGAEAFLSGLQIQERFTDVQKMCRYIELSLEPDFSDEYIDQMTFQEV